jgi:flagellar export protein FliJ
VKTFRFPLQRVLDWRALQMRTEEEKLSGLQQTLAALVHRETALLAEQLKSEMELLGQPSIDGSDLQALASYQLRIQHERDALRANRVRCESQIAEQRTRLLKARKDCRVLEKLKDKRWRTWTYLSDREVEHTAAENYISKWVREELENMPEA